MRRMLPQANLVEESMVKVVDKVDAVADTQGTMMVRITIPTLELYCDFSAS